MDTSTSVLDTISEYITRISGSFYQDVISGLSSSPKRLDSKYFYDANGDKLFQQIMHSEEYYPTNCELEIFSGQTAMLTGTIGKYLQSFDLVELGAGDALKSSFLLDNLLKNNIDFNYFPIDISENVISQLTQKIPHRFPGINMQGLNGEYFEMLEVANRLTERNKLILFLGSNIGNMVPADAEIFCLKLRQLLSPGDLLLIGFDLKKNPQVILNAYNDKQGLTRQFNLNLLTRINTELGGNFDTGKFEHYPTYDPETGTCKSYLISLENQQVNVGDNIINFIKNEHIWMEVSQKYTVAQTDQLAQITGFEPVAHFFDSKKWFADVLWKC